ncbi:uncharacterized protein [Dermacentor albipictus]|uniref:uncharacterized protein n=1 Tax=Dermacentor albipictus TaxID=60249 RepID=UPI0038FCAF1C
MDTILPYRHDSTETTTLSEAAAHAEECRKLSRIFTSKDQQRQKHHRESSNAPVSYAPGSLVLLWGPASTTGLSMKLASKYQGPYRVVKQTSPVNYIVEPLVLPLDHRHRGREIVHAQRLEPYYDPPVLSYPHPSLTELPEDGRTLLRAPRQAQERCGLTPLEPGEYCYFGLKAGLLRILCHVEHPPSVIPLSFNIDGLPLSKSSKMQLWPIQCIAHACGDGTPFLVGAFAELSKPASSREFLRPFVVELQELISEGVAVDGSVVQVSMAYAIIEFLALQEVEVVPSTWIKGNRCAWPPEHSKGDKIVAMVKKAAMPDASWKCFEVSVKGLFGTYELARRKLNRSERDSDLNTDSDVPLKRSRKPPQPWSDSDDSEVRFQCSALDLDLH